MKQTVEDFIALGWRESILDKVLHTNARRLLRLPG
jgi:predicted TIM-barrel fold metal-dependent hydrolase